MWTGQLSINLQNANDTGTQRYTQIWNQVDIVTANWTQDSVDLASLHAGLQVMAVYQSVKITSCYVLNSFSPMQLYFNSFYGKPWQPQLIHSCISSSSYSKTFCSHDGPYKRFFLPISLPHACSCPRYLQCPILPPSWSTHVSSSRNHTHHCFSFQTIVLFNRTEVLLFLKHDAFYEPVFFQVWIL